MESQSSKNRLLWKSALILTLAGMITKILSAAYRIPFQNIAGDVGFYIYQQVYPFYGVALILSTYGFPVIISKLVAEQTESKKGNIIRVLTVSIVFLSIFFLLIFLLSYTGAEKIAALMGDKELAIPLKVVSFSFLFVPVLSVLRGYFQGINNMTPTAISQIGEQSVRVTTILLFSYYLFHNGYSSYIGASGAVFGSITGGFCSTLILIYFWMKKCHYHNIKLSNSLTKTTVLSIIKGLVGQGFTICISSLFLILLQMVDAMTIYSLLIKSGDFSLTEAKVIKGVFDRGQPLIQLGTVVATSLSLTLVPLISSAKARNDFGFIREKVHLSIRVSVIVGLGASLGLIAIIKPTNIMLFKNINGSTELSILALTILFSSLTMTATAIIQGLGKGIAPAAYVIIGVVCKIILNYFLIPKLGTNGAAIATVIAFSVTTFLNIKTLSKMIGIPLLTSYVMKVLVAGVCMGGCLYFYQFLLNGVYGSHLANSRMFAAFQSLTGVTIGGFVYILFVIKSKVFTEQELSTLPFGTRLGMLMKGKG